MAAEKEKSMLMVEMLEKFAPYMDRSTDLFREMGLMITAFGSLVESLSEELAADKKVQVMDFIKQFNSYIEHSSETYQQLNDFYAFMAGKTNEIINEYKNLMGM